ncbi:MAG: DUF3175 domain-containing protein [Thermoplasmatota archaeon]
MRSENAIARNLHRSAERSRRRNSTPYRSAISMTAFDQHGAGRKLTPTMKRRLGPVKRESRKASKGSAGPPNEPSIRPEREQGGRTPVKGKLRGRTKT